MPRRRPRSRSEGPSFLGGVFVIIAKTTLLLVSLLAIAELAAGLTLDRLRDGAPKPVASPARDEDLVRLYDTAQPQMYRDLLDEQAQIIRTTYHPVLEYRMAEAHGKSYTVDEHGRRSNGQPSPAPADAARVFVFGNSTVLGIGVANHETIPAQMAEILTAAGKSVQVENFGAKDYGIEQERILLERLLLSGQRPAVAVFVDGLADFCDCRDGGSTAWSRRLATLSRHMSGEEMVFRPHMLQLYQWFHGGQETMAGRWGAPCEDDSAVQRLIDRVQENRKMIQALAERYQFKTVFVQQPVPVYHYDNARRPVRVTTEQLGHYVNAAPAYTRLADMRANQTIPEPAPLWLAELEPAEGNAYIDPIHYSPRFNRTIADTIARYVLDQSMVP